MCDLVELCVEQVNAWENDKIKAQRVKMESLPPAKLSNVLSHLPNLSFSLLLTLCDVTEQNGKDLGVNSGIVSVYLLFVLISFENALQIAREHLYNTPKLLCSTR